MFKFKSKEKKDSAYGLIYAWIGVIIWRFNEQIGIGQDLGEDAVDAISTNII